MNKEYRIDLLKKLSDYSIDFKEILEIANEGATDRLSYMVVYNILNGRTKDKHQRVLNACLKAISNAKNLKDLIEKL